MNTARFRVEGFKVLALLSLVSLVAFSGNLMAKGKGAELAVTKTNGDQVKGELIAVKRDSMILLDSATGADVSIGISDINSIKEKKKLHPLLGIGVGFLAGCVAGLVWPSGKSNVNDNTVAGIIVQPIINRMNLVGLGGCIGAAAGGLIGASPGCTKPFQVAGKPQEETKVYLEQLRSKARVPDAQ